MQQITKVEPKIWEDRGLRRVRGVIPRVDGLVHISQFFSGGGRPGGGGRGGDLNGGRRNRRDIDRGGRDRRW